MVPAALRDVERTAKKSQQSDDVKFSRKFDSQDEDLGSWDVIKEVEELVWYPSEVDTSIRTGWFYHPEEDTQVRTADELLAIYLDAVGANASLLLNLPPDTHGKIAKPDCDSLKELGKKISEIFAHEITNKAEITADSADGQPICLAIDGSRDTFWKAAEGQEQNHITLNFKEEEWISCVVLGEYLPEGQRIENGEILADGKKITEFTVVGHKRICRFTPVKAKNLMIKITSSRTEPTLRLLAMYQ